MYVGLNCGSPRHNTSQAVRSLGCGRFLEPDPIGYEASPNLYAYVGNDPINFVDPLGLDEEPEPPIVVTGSRCPSGWSCYDPGFGFQTVSTDNTIVVTANRLAQTAGGGRSGGEIIVTASRPRGLTQCMINFLTSQGLGSPNLRDIRFIPSMNGNAAARFAERRGHGAITLGNNIYVSPGQWRDIANPLAGPTYFEEVIHSVQWHISGRANFALSYALGIPFGHDNHVEAQAMGLSKKLYEAYLTSRPAGC